MFVILSFIHFELILTYYSFFPLTFKLNSYFIAHFTSLLILEQFKMYLFICLFLAVLGPCCCTGLSLVEENGGYSLAEVCRLLIAMAFAVEHRLQGTRVSVVEQHMGSIVAASRLQITGSIIVAYGVICSEACGIFLDQELNLH